MSIEKTPRRLSRIDLLSAALGAGVLLAVATYAGLGPARQTSGREEAKPAISEKYPKHTEIITTVFWAGEAADASNDYISNAPSAWEDDWVKSFGGIDDPDDRCGYKPCTFMPKQNAFYFALPFGDYTDKGPKPASKLKMIPWYKEPLKEGESILKNRWIEIIFDDKKAYAQWEDVGPVNEDDADYVFGSARPKEVRSGLDVSPAVSDYLGLERRGKTSWRFIEESEVPDGPWKETVTSSGPRWGN